MQHVPSPTSRTAVPISFVNEIKHPVERNSANENGHINNWQIEYRVPNAYAWFQVFQAGRVKTNRFANWDTLFSRNWCAASWVHSMCTIRNTQSKFEATNDLNYQCYWVSPD